MKIKSLSFKNTLTGWNVQDLHFEDLTLLVGASGVGKTKILSSLQRLTNVAKGRAYDAINWVFSFENAGNEYLWSGELSKHSDVELSLFEEPKDVSFVREKLVCNGTTILDRTDSEMRYQDRLTVKLDQTRSAIALLSEEDDLKPVVMAFSKIRYIRNDWGGSPFRNRDIENINKLDVKRERKIRALSLAQLLYLLRVNNLPEFEEIKADFINVFPFVRDIDVAVRKIYDDISAPYIRIKEKGINNMISQEDISSGMMRTLHLITELKLAEDGDVFLMDEFENGLGINCIDKLADLIINPDKDIQVIVTSHHPYIINNIPVENWKVVTRNKADVRVVSAAEINVGTHSKHDAFMQLVNSSAYKMGIL